MNNQKMKIRNSHQEIKVRNKVTKERLLDLKSIDNVNEPFQSFPLSIKWTETEGKFLLFKKGRSLSDITITKDSILLTDIPRIRTSYERHFAKDKEKMNEFLNALAFVEKVLLYLTNHLELYVIEDGKVVAESGKIVLEDIVNIIQSGIKETE